MLSFAPVNIPPTDISKVVTFLVTDTAPIPFEKFGYDKEKPGEYARISGEIFDEICRLGDTVAK